jgi:hypothetical protein
LASCQSAANKKGWNLLRRRTEEEWEQVPIFAPPGSPHQLNGLVLLDKGYIVGGASSFRFGSRVNYKNEEYGDHFFSDPSWSPHFYWRTASGAVIVLTYRDWYWFWGGPPWLQWVLHQREVTVHDDRRGFLFKEIRLPRLPRYSWFVIYLVVIAAFSAVPTEGPVGLLGLAGGLVFVLLATLGVLLVRSLWRRARELFPSHALPRMPRWDEL